MSHRLPFGKGRAPRRPEKMRLEYRLDRCDKLKGKALTALPANGLGPPAEVDFSFVCESATR